MGPKVVVNWDTFEHLCQEVEKFPAIWDKQHPDHKKPKCIAEMWAQIDEECPEYEGRAKAEWTKPGGVRERFRKEIQKGKKTVKSGAVKWELRCKQNHNWLANQAASQAYKPIRFVSSQPDWLATFLASSSSSGNRP